MGIIDQFKNLYIWLAELPTGFKIIMTVHLAWIILGFF